MKNIGIFSGTFDPVHIGHTAFALAAIEKVDLDKVVFLPERQPRHKKNVADYNHRLSMLKLGVKPFAKLEVLDLPDPFFTTEDTLPKLLKHFADSQLFLLVGSDVAKNINDWPEVEMLAKKVSLVVGTRHSHSQEELGQTLGKLLPALHIIFVRTRYPQINSTMARTQPTKELDPAVTKYIRSHNLYQD